jgi:glycosyltransferase involved in cell wall biosynthesis
MTAQESGTAPWLSVIIPGHRSEQWIRATLDSVEAEVAEGVEVLLVDSSPTSATRDIAQTYLGRLNLKMFERPDLPTWQAKTNFAAGIAAADHLCMLHHDDLWLPGRAQHARAWIEAAPDMPLHLAPTAIVDRSGRRLGVWRCPLPADRAIPSAEVLERLLVQCFISTPAPVFRKDAWLACCGLDEALWFTADWDIWLKLAARGSVLYHDSVTTAFRVHGGSLTMTGSRDISDFTQQLEIVLDRHLPGLTAGSESVVRRARVSIAVNTALALASAGNPSLLPRAASEVLRLGPSGVYRYLRDSRIIERVAPRVRAKLSGTF